MADLGRYLVDNTWVWTSLAGIALGVLVFLLSADGRDWAPILVMASVRCSARC